MSSLLDFPTPTRASRDEIQGPHWVCATHPYFPAPYRGATPPLTRLPRKPRETGRVSERVAGGLCTSVGCVGLQRWYEPFEAPQGGHEGPQGLRYLGGVMRPHEEAFRRFHEENPQVYGRLRHLAFRLKAKGVERYGIKALWEVLRYEEHLSTAAPVGCYALNNNYTAHYARLLMAQEDDLVGFFEVRQRRSQEDEGDA